MPGAPLKGVDWTRVATSLTEEGWVRLEGVVDNGMCARLVAAAPGTWQPETETIGDVRQSGLSCGVSFDGVDRSVREVGLTICDSLATALPPDTPPIPCFNAVTWNRTQNGIGYITAHRDPPTAGGVIATVTLWGQARFRVWTRTRPTEWVTGDGDLVILRGHGWPTADSTCPIHEAESPVVGERMTMTLRFNTRGPDASYFDELYPA
jgi:hypothetical protein